MAKEQVRDSVERDGGLPAARRALHDQVLVGFISDRAVLLTLNRGDDGAHPAVRVARQHLLEHFVVDLDAAVKAVDELAVFNLVLALAGELAFDHAAWRREARLADFVVIKHAAHRRAPVVHQHAVVVRDEAEGADIVTLCRVLLHRAEVDSPEIRRAEDFLQLLLLGLKDAVAALLLLHDADVFQKIHELIQPVGGGDGADILPKLALGGDGVVLQLVIACICLAILRVCLRQDGFQPLFFRCLFQLIHPWSPLREIVVRLAA